MARQRTRFERIARRIAREQGLVEEIRLHKQDLLAELGSLPTIEEVYAVRLPDRDRREP